MARRIEVYLYGRSLQEADRRIIVQEFVDGLPETEIEFGERPGRFGRRLLTRRRAQKEVRVQFQLRELRDLAERRRILDAACAWAQDGYLSTSAHPRRRLPVIVTERPTAQTARQYTETFEIAFVAAALPYWEDEDETRVTLTDGAGRILNGGTAPALIGAEITVAEGETLNELEISAGGETMAFENLGAAGGSVFRLGYDFSGTQLITLDGASVLSKRTPESADELYAQPGANAVTVTADADVASTIKLRGCWL